MLNNTPPPPPPPPPQPLSPHLRDVRCNQGATDNRGDPQGLLSVHAHHAPTDPPKPPRHRSPAHNNDGHPKPHPNSKDTTTGPTTHHTPQTTTHDSCHHLSQDTGHSPSAPTAPDMPHHPMWLSPQQQQPPQPTPQQQRHHNWPHNPQQPMTATATCPRTHIAQPPPPLPARESPHQHPPPVTVTIPARPGQHREVLLAPHTHTHTTQPQCNSQSTAQTTWHCPSTPPLTQQYNHQLHPTHATLHLHHPHAASKLLAMVEYGWEWRVGQVGELVPEPPCTPLPCKEQG
jgi:hypothetical protein